MDEDSDIRRIGRYRCLVCGEPVDAVRIVPHAKTHPRELDQAKSITIDLLKGESDGAR